MRTIARAETLLADAEAVAMNYDDTVIVDARHSSVLSHAGETDSSAMHCLGRSYFEGVGVIRDLARSYAWYLRAGRTGHGSERCFQGACTFFHDRL